MDKDYFIKLTLGVYRVTGLFPPKEPLKLKIREQANNILAGLILCAGNPTKIASSEKKRISENVWQNMEIIKGYFKVAEGQKWIDPSNFLFLKREYNRIRREIENKEDKPKKEDQTSTKPIAPEIIVLKKVNHQDHQLTDRQEKILQLLQRSDKTQVGELAKDFADVSKRTLQRDLEILVSRGLLLRNGSNNGIFYQLKDKSKNL